ncbi:IS110 family RNA-guided transposase (plasmid) [Enterococcus avium]
MKLFVGLDVSSEKLDACFMTDDSTCSVLKEASYGNSQLGASQIKEYILEFSQKFEIESLVIGMEATSLYSFHPAMFFKEDLELNQLNLMVSVEQPNKIKKYRDIFEENKNDQIDAFYIADYFRIQRQVNSIIKEEEYLALQHLTRTRYQLIKQLVRTKQHFIENIYYKCNTLSKELKAEGGSVLSATLVTLMTEDYTMDQLAELSLEEFANLIQKLGKYRFKNPEGIAKAISKAIRSSYRLGKVHQDSVDIVLGVLAKEIRSLEKLIKDLDKAIDDLVVVLPEYQCLTSIPGIGPVYAAGILAEIGPINRFSDESKLAKYAGLYWRQNQSGNSEYENTPMAKRGNRYLRYYLVEATNSVRRYKPEYHAYYKKKYAETPKHKHKRAIVLTARKFTRLVDTLLRNHQLYMPPRSVIDK